jgi:hypothetical protein
MVFFLLSRVAPHNYKTGSRVRVQTNRSGCLAPHFKKPFAYPPAVIRPSAVKAVKAVISLLYPYNHLFFFLFSNQEAQARACEE